MYTHLHLLAYGPVLIHIKCLFLKFESCILSDIPIWFDMGSEYKVCTVILMHNVCILEGVG